MLKLFSALIGIYAFLFMFGCVFCVDQELAYHDWTLREVLETIISAAFGLLTCFAFYEAASALVERIQTLLR